MRTPDILEALAKGATLCKGYEPDGTVYWLEPRRIIIRADVALNIIPMLQESGDGLFEDATQTWKAK